MTDCPYRLGWTHELEDHDYLQRYGADWQGFGAFAAPESFDPRPFLRVEDQGQQGSCSGQASTTVAELIEYLSTGTGVQLSRQHSYITGQKHAGLIGSDRGCTITGVVQAAKKNGHCLEHLMPYTGAYYTQIPKAARDQAKNHLIETHVDLKPHGHRGVLEFLRAGQGGIIIGIPWTEGLAYNKSGIITVANSGGREFGGHAVALAGWVSRGDIWLGNSHGPDWGNGGWALCEPRWVDQICQKQWSEIVGVSDLTNDFGEPREFSFLENNPWV